MKKLEKSFENLPLVSREILNGNVICSPTDTLYGLIGSALSKKVYETMYRLKKRSREKPLIVLFDCLERAKEFGVVIPRDCEAALSKIFPERLTVIVPLRKNSYLHGIVERDNVAFRIPKDDFLVELVKLSHPLFAPSANPEGGKPAEDCRDCEAYFKDGVSLCLKGKAFGKPSTIVSLVEGNPKLVREGAFPFQKFLEVLGG